MRDAIIKLKAVRESRGQHAGLILQRYLTEVGVGEGSNIATEKRAVLNAAIAAAKNDEVRALYRAAFKRWSASLPTDPPPVDLATTGRLIVGLGSENVLETGIRLHHTYGMPILPGSALKGLAAHYCDQVWGPTDKRFKQPTKSEDEAYRKYLAGKETKLDDNFHRFLFGSTDDGGCIAFHDAWLHPDSKTPLVLDVMTPHHPKWLDGSVAPTDFDSPKPVPFLSVTGTFRVAVSWHGPPSGEAKTWTELARSLLCDALRDWGVGGKTSSGYGRLVDPKTLVNPATREASNPAGVSTGTRPQSATVPQPGQTVECVFLAEKTKRGGWKARHDPSGLEGPIQNSDAVPGDKNPGDRLELIVAMANAREIAFRYPTPADERRAEKKGNPKSQRGGRPPRGRK